MSDSYQINNPALVDNLAGVFQKRYDAALAWRGAVGLHTMLNGLRGFWPYSSRDENDDVFDCSEQDRTLTNNSATVFAVQGLAVYATHDGSADYLSRADEAGLDITGALTAGCWVYVDDPHGSAQGIMAKWNATGNQRSWRFYADTTPAIIAQMSNAGAAVEAQATSADIDLDTWLHAVIRFIPSTSLSIFVNGVEVADTSSVPASLFNSSQAFEVGAMGGASVLGGRTALPFLCAANLSDGTIQAIYHHTRALFGV